MNVQTDKPFKIVYSLTLNSPVGPIVEPFAVQLNEYDHPTLSYQRIHETNIKNFDNGLNEQDYELVKLMDEYAHETLAKKFGKKKSRPVDFLNNEITEDYLKDTIRPYIEIRLRKILRILFEFKGLYLNGRSGNPTWKTLDIVNKPATVIFKFKNQEEGTRYYPTIKTDPNKDHIRLANKHAHIIVFEPCLLLVNTSLYHFAHPLNGKKIKPFINKPYLDIPAKAEPEFYKKFIPQIIENYQVEAEPFDILKPHVEPYPILQLTKDIKGVPSLLLTFQYGEVNFYAENPKKVYVYQQANETKYQFVKIERSRQWELDKIQLLKDLGLVSHTPNFFYPDAARPGSHSEKEDYTHLHTFLKWLNQNRETLSEAGFAIYQDIQETDFFLGEPEIRFEVQETGNDWFDIHARVYFGEESVPFIQLKNNILNGVREFRLPSGKIAILPDEWFTEYLDFLKFSEEDKDSETLKLQKHHYNLLNRVNGNGQKGIGKDYFRTLKNLDPESQEVPKLPNNFHVQLRDYQKEGFSWLYALRENNFGGCLADDMGLGKTLQTLTLLLKDKEEADLNPQAKVNASTDQPDLFSGVGDEVNSRELTKAPNVIIMPSSLIHNWKAEILKFTPQLSCLQYTGNDRLSLLQSFYRYDIILTTYGLVRNDIEYLRDIDFNYIILDESQIIKNPSSKTAKVVKQLFGKNRLVLTGTPIENTLTDLWSQMAFLNPGLLGGYQFFKKEYVHPIEKKNDETKREKLKTLIKPFLLRRTKEEVTQELPSLTEKTQFCEMSEAHEKEYERIKSFYRNQIMQNIEQYGFKQSQFMILQGLTQLRLAANHPILVNEAFAGDSGKFNEIMRHVENVTNENHKILIFSQFVKHLSLFKDYLQEVGIGYTLLTGSTKNREGVIQEFREDPKKQVFLISLKAGGVGLNLVEADYVFITDPWWNPATESQAINRAHRIGQDKSVISYKFITQGTIEEKILKLQEKKSALVRDIITANQNMTNQLTEEDLELLLN